MILYEYNEEVLSVEYTKNFGFRHKAGIILPVSSLPSKYGIGSFGREAHDFIDFLDATGQKCWQVLPTQIVIFIIYLSFPSLHSNVPFLSYHIR